MVKLQIDAEFAGCRIHDPQAFGHDFFANAISRNDSDTVLAHTGYFLWIKKQKVRKRKNKSLATKQRSARQGRDGRTTKLTPTAVRAVPKRVAMVMVSPNSSHAMMAVVGGTKYIRLVTDAAAPR
jgi:hypothetical protein